MDTSLDYERGYDAFISGSLLSHNPWKPGYQNYWDWRAGWFAARWQVKVSAS